MRKAQTEALTSSDFEVITRKPRILIFDIETAPCVGEFWSRPWQTNIIRIIHDTHMIGFSAKWYQGKQITRCLADYKGYKPGSRDDKALVTELRELIDQADVCVAHHGKKFDFPYTNGRFVVNGLAPARNYKPYDTRERAARLFKFTSNKLDDIARMLGLGAKIPIHYDTWVDCSQGDPKAWKRMKTYNAHDTKLLEMVYEKFKPFDSQHPNMNLLLNQAEGCPSCGSQNKQKRGFGYTTTGRRQEYQCMNCDRRFSGKHQMITQYR